MSRRLTGRTVKKQRRLKTKNRHNRRNYGCETRGQERETTRRKRQIDRGQLREANGLVR